MAHLTVPKHPKNTSTIPFTEQDLRQLETTYRFLLGLSELFYRLNDGEIGGRSLEAVLMPATEQLECFYKEIQVRFEEGGAA